MAIFAKQAYRDGLGVTTLLATRFALAAAIFWAIVWVRRARRPAAEERAAAVPPARNVVLAAILLGAVGYSFQAGLFFNALTYIDASLTSLLLYTFPALVCIGSLALGRERLSPLKTGALVLASAGTALVLLGGGSGGLQATGVLLGLGAGITYSIYILVAVEFVPRIDAWLFSALVSTGAAATITLVGVARGALDVPGGSAWIWIVAIALFSTVIPISTFLLGLELVGGPTASIVSTIEPVLTVLLAVLWLGESLAAAQLLGGVLVVAAVLALQSRRAERGVSVGHDVAAPAPAGAAPARTPASEAA